MPFVPTVVVAAIVLLAGFRHHHVKPEFTIEESTFEVSQCIWGHYRGKAIDFEVCNDVKTGRTRKHESH